MLVYHTALCVLVLLDYYVSAYYVAAYVLDEVRARAGGLLASANKTNFFFLEGFLASQMLRNSF